MGDLAARNRLAVLVAAAEEIVPAIQEAHFRVGTPRIAAAAALWSCSNPLASRTMTPSPIEARGCRMQVSRSRSSASVLRRAVMSRQSRCSPWNSVGVVDRPAGVDEPAVFPVVAAQTVFHLDGRPDGKMPEIAGDAAVEVVGDECWWSSRASSCSRLRPVKFQPGLVEIGCSRRQAGTPDQRGQVVEQGHGVVPVGRGVERRVICHGLYGTKGAWRIAITAMPRHSRSFLEPFRRLSEGPASVATLCFPVWWCGLRRGGWRVVDPEDAGGRRARRDHSSSASTALAAARRQGLRRCRRRLRTSRRRPGAAPGRAGHCGSHALDVAVDAQEAGVDVRAVIVGQLGQEAAWRGQRHRRCRRRCC